MEKLARTMRPDLFQKGNEMFSVFEAVEKAMSNFVKDKTMSIKETAFFWLFYAVVRALVDIKHES